MKDIDHLTYKQYFLMLTYNNCPGFSRPIATYRFNGLISDNTVSSSCQKLVHSRAGLWNTSQCFHWFWFFIFGSTDSVHQFNSTHGTWCLYSLTRTTPFWANSYLPALPNPAKSDFRVTCSNQWKLLHCEPVIMPSLNDFLSASFTPHIQRVTLQKKNN